MTDEIKTKPNYYTPAVKKAVYKHREANRESYNDYLRAYQREMMNDPIKAARKKEHTKRSNEKVRLRRIADRDALMDKINIVKTELSSVAENDLQTIIITANNIVL